MTKLWYEVTINRLESSSYLLDIGVGNATSLLGNIDTIRTKGINIKGVDFTQAYVDAAQKNICSSSASFNVSVVYGSVYDLSLLKSLAPAGQSFDAAYFSGSISLLPEPLDALRMVAKVLKKGGLIYVTQTYQHRNVPGLATFKRNMKFFTTIDFGELTFEKDIMEIYRKSGFEILEHKPIEGSVDNTFQTAYLTILKTK